VDLYIHSPILLHGVVLNQLSTGTTLPFYLIHLTGGCVELRVGLNMMARRKIRAPAGDCTLVVRFRPSLYGIRYLVLIKYIDMSHLTPL
jgi:hypothetical protein